MNDWMRGVGFWLASGYRAAPALAVFATLLRVSVTVAAPVQAYGVKLLVDGLIGRDGDTLITGAAIMVTTLAVTLAMLSFDDAVFQTMLDRIHPYLHHRLIATVAGIPGVEHHERPDVADQIELLHKDWRLLTFSFHSLLAVVAAIANAGLILALLAAIHPVLLALPLLGVLRVWASYVDSRLQQNAREATAKHTRLATRLAKLATSPRHGVEVRVFGLGNVLLERLDTQLRHVEMQRVYAARVGVAYEIGARVVFGLAYAAAIVYIAQQARQGSVSPGDLALVVLLGWRVEQAASGIATAAGDTGQTIRMFTRLAWLGRYAGHAAWADSTSPAPRRLRTGITLRDVEFCYPGTNHTVLRDINVELPAGSTVAIVGENGAGKTTLIKLLARLYDPTSGAVLIDDRDLREITPEAWRARLAAAFQDFVRYELTAGETVGVGDLPRLHDNQALHHALERGDATQLLHKLPNGLNTQLGRRFTDGVELSGGQWQRLALARAFMRTRPLLLVLDEPTAALDPEAEHALFQRYATASRDTARRTGGITVLVSHRFSTVRMADHILVLHNGRIIETGTHHDLTAAGGHYAELFALQARTYQDRPADQPTDHS